jgi:hypothetical protein
MHRRADTVISETPLKDVILAIIYRWPMIHAFSLVETESLSLTSLQFPHYMTILRKFSLQCTVIGLIFREDYYELGHRMQAPRKMKAIRHIWDDRVRIPRKRQPEPKEELQHSFLMSLICTCCFWRRRVQNYRNDLQDFDFNKDVRKIGRSFYYWKRLRTK